MCQKGYQVAVAEQIDNDKVTDSCKAVQRELTAKYTKGTCPPLKKDFLQSQNILVFLKSECGSPDTDHIPNCY